MTEQTTIDKIKAGVKHTKEIDFPGVDGAKILIRLCNEEDNLQASHSADDIFENHKIGLENASAYDAERETQLLYRAVLDPATKKQLCKSMLEFRQILTPETKDSLAVSLDELHQEFSPDPSTLTEKEFDSLVEDVKKNGEEALTNVFDTHTLKRLSIYLGSQLYK